VDLSQATIDQLGKFGDWNAALNFGGPFDEPSFCFTNGMILSRDGYFRQAAARFNRVCQLAPDFLPARLMLAQSFLFNHLPAQAIDALREPLDHPEKFSMDETNKIAVVTLTAAAYFLQTNSAHAIELLDGEMSRHLGDNNWAAASAQIFIARGLFTNALAIIDRRLESVSDDPAWFYSKGYVCIQLKKYPAAISAFSRVLEIQTNNFDALFNRALANLDSDHLDAARGDYLRLQQQFTNAPPVAYGLGEIAWRNHQTNEAVRNYEIYLANARTNTAEAKTVAERLKSLKR
jgi:tetratricopeptide (TPR) repeat protein